MQTHSFTRANSLIHSNKLTHSLEQYKLTHSLPSLLFLIKVYWINKPQWVERQEGPVRSSLFRRWVISIFGSSIVGQWMFRRLVFRRWVFRRLPRRTWQVAARRRAPIVGTYYPVYVYPRRHVRFRREEDACPGNLLLSKIAHRYECKCTGHRECVERHKPRGGGLPPQFY
jgi:hypothetical protein